VKWIIGKDKWRKKLKMKKSKLSDREVLNLMDSQDKESIQLRHEYLKLPEDSISRKVIVRSDNLYRIRDSRLIEIKEMVWSIKNIKVKIGTRLKPQLMSGIITEILPDQPGLRMNKDEMELYIEHQQKVAWSIAKDIVTRLKELRSVVDHKDYDGVYPLPLKKYEEYVERVDNKIQELGYNIFETIHEKLLNL